MNWNKPIAKTILLAFCVLTLLPAQEGPLVAGEGEKKVITSGYGKNPDEPLRMVPLAVKIQKDGQLINLDTGGNQTTLF